MTADEVEKIRDRILDTALEIIIEEGFNNLSVRKIASRINVTATTIYNYYTNKDELNLRIRMRGFEKLHALLMQGASGTDDLMCRFRGMGRAYVHFGRTYPGYYDLMFSLHTPKYLDYVGTNMETTASLEKEKALSCLSLFIAPVSDYIPGRGKKKDRFVLYQIVRYWSDLHGLVTLCNSRLFHEVIDDVDRFVEKRIDDMFEQFAELKRRVDNGDALF